MIRFAAAKVRKVFDFLRNPLLFLGENCLLFLAKCRRRRNTIAAWQIYPQWRECAEIKTSRPPVRAFSVGIMSQTSAGRNCHPTTKLQKVPETIPFLAFLVLSRTNFSSTILPPISFVEATNTHILFIRQTIHHYDEVVLYHFLIAGKITLNPLDFQIKVVKTWLPTIKFLYFLQSVRLSLHVSDRPCSTCCIASASKTT